MVNGTSSVGLSGALQGCGQLFTSTLATLEGEREGERKRKRASLWVNVFVFLEDSMKLPHAWQGVIQDIEQSRIDWQIPLGNPYFSLR